MSHFTVLVPANDEDQLHKLLIPYYELGTSEARDEEVKPYIEFKDMREECQKEYETETWAKVVMPDGQFLNPYDKEFQVPSTRRWEKKYKVPEALEQRDVPYTELYPTLKAFIENYHGYEYNEEQETWGYWHNPNKKWDWYSVGGRWSGLLQLKPITGMDIRFYPSGPETGSGKGGAFNTANNKPSKCDWTYAGYVDWEGMGSSEHARRMDQYHTYHTVKEETANLPISEAALVLGTKDYKKDDRRGESIRKRFPSATDYARHKLLEKILYDEHKVDIWSWKRYDGFEQPEKVYSAQFARRAQTYAYLDLEGKWHGRAEMGWWGMDSNYDDSYDKQWWDFVESLPSDQRVYVVDCHI